MNSVIDVSQVMDRREQRAVVQTETAVTPLQILLRAIQDPACDLVKLEKLMELEARWRAAQAKQAYVQAFAQFKQNVPDVVKDMLNKQYDSDYSSLANLVNTVNKALGAYGLNARWGVNQTGGMTVTCIMTHVEGHSEEVPISGPIDNSGSKNPLQQIKSTLTYLEGATFQAITGVVARSACADDDGNSSGKKEVEAPQGYADWRADMSALADEGSERLQGAWKATSDEYRRHVVKHDDLWWGETKRKAAKASKAEA